jgi:hypothetical protein
MRIFIIPQPGRLVRDPHTKQPVPAGGRFVELDSFWTRRLDDGDVKDIDPPTDAQE